MKKILLIMAISFVASCGGGGSTSPGGPGPDSVSSVVKKVWEGSSLRTPIADEVKQTSPKGVTVYSRNGLSQDFLVQADEALTELFADVQAAYPGQADPVSLDFKVYDIYEPDHDCTPSPEQRVPSFYLKDALLQYDESQWDQYPGVGKSVVLAPERVFAMTTSGSSIYINGVRHPPRARMIVCPDLANWRNSVRYGGEHNIGESSINVSNAELFALAAANRTHTSGGHPFIPSRAQGLKAQSKTNWSEFAPPLGE